MKNVMIANAVIMSVYAMCVTYAAIQFDNPKLLWWYVLLTVIGFSYNRKADDNDTEPPKGE